jgi:hypothetical protein
MMLDRATCDARVHVSSFIADFFLAAAATPRVWGRVD